MEEYLNNTSKEILCSEILALRSSRVELRKKNEKLESEIYLYKNNQHSDQRQQRLKISRHEEIVERLKSDCKNQIELSKRNALRESENIKNQATKKTVLLCSVFMLFYSIVTLVYYHPSKVVYRKSHDALVMQQNRINLRLTKDLNLCKGELYNSRLKLRSK